MSWKSTNVAIIENRTPTTMIGLMERPGHPPEELPGVGPVDLRGLVQAATDGSIRVFPVSRSHLLADDRGPVAAADWVGTARPRSILGKAEHPLSFVGSPRRALGDLRVRAPHLGGHQGQLLVDLAPVQLCGRTLRPGAPPHRIFVRLR